MADRQSDARPAVSMTGEGEKENKQDQVFMQFKLL